jgi:hypothetical protein
MLPLGESLCANQAIISWEADASTINKKGSLLASASFFRPKDFVLLHCFCSVSLLSFCFTASLFQAVKLTPCPRGICNLSSAASLLEISAASLALG